MTPVKQSKENSTIEQKKAIALSFLSALKQNDWQSIRQLMDKDVTWTLPGESILSGKASGVDAVIKRAKSLKKFGVVFELLHVLYGMTGFTLSLHNTASRADLVLDEFVAIVFELSEGKIQSMATHLSDVNGINHFFITGIID